jgi:cardiolipin synthase
MLHTKLLVIDQEFVSVGSTNFDPRSFRLHDEASLNTYEHEFAQQLSSVFEADLGAATPYTLQMWNRRPMREKLAERLLWPIRSQL